MCDPLENARNQRRNWTCQWVLSVHCLVDSTGLMSRWFLRVSESQTKRWPWGSRTHHSVLEGYAAVVCYFLNKCGTSLLYVDNNSGTEGFLKNHHLENSASPKDALHNSRYREVYQCARLWVRCCVKTLGCEEERCWKGCRACAGSDVTSIRKIAGGPIIETLTRGRGEATNCLLYTSRCV